jgi:hypothetical protein
VSGAKMREFIPPGDVIEFEAKVNSRAGDTVVIAVNSRRGQRALGGSKVTLTRGGPP